jgi:hypothetical protein
MAGFIITDSPLTPIDSSPAPQDIEDSPAPQDTGSQRVPKTIDTTPPNEQLETGAPLAPARGQLDSSPVRHTQATYIDFATIPPPHASELQPKLDAEMRQAFIGPLPIQKFFDDFLPVTNIPSPVASPEFASMAEVTSEKNMYGNFVRSFSSLGLFSFIYSRLSSSVP